jgi:hypothetical protein
MKAIRSILLSLLAIMMGGGLMILQLSAAEIYKWVDEKGTVHFTEDPSTVPEKYLDKVRTRTTQEDSMTPEGKGRAKGREEEGTRDQ